MKIMPKHMYMFIYIKTHRLTTYKVHKRVYVFNVCIYNVCKVYICI